MVRQSVYDRACLESMTSDLHARKHFQAGEAELELLYWASQSQAVLAVTTVVNGGQWLLHRACASTNA